MDLKSYLAICLILFLLSGICTVQPSRNALQSTELGQVLVLPLSRQERNHSLGSYEVISHRFRYLLDTLDANAKMKLYDDLLSRGYYTTRLWIGTPPQEFALIVDTGSTITYVPCSSCTQCGTHQDPWFKPESSSTYKPVECGPSCSFCDSDKHQCKYVRRYAEMSTSEGLLGTDLLSFGNFSTIEPERLVFGCETAESGDIHDQRADGIMGLGRGAYSIVDQLINSNAMTASFSLCYGGMGQGGGAMVMGAIPNPPQMVFTKSDFRRSAYYNLELHQVIVAGTPLAVDPVVFDSKFGTVIDSGTTYAYFPDIAYKAFTQALSQQVKLDRIDGPDSHYPDVCYGGAGTDSSKLREHFPEVQFKFGDGQIVSLAPENYLFQHLKVPGGYCLGIFSNGRSSSTLLGGIVVRNMLVTYDRVNERIGFWRTNCSDLWSSLQVAMEVTAAPPPVESPVLPKQASSPNTPDLMSISGTVDVVMYLKTNFNDFDSLKPIFLERISIELQVNESQVSIVEIKDTGGNVTVIFTVEITAADKHILNDHVQRMIAQLSTKQVRLGNAFGDYQLLHWTLVLGDKRSSMSLEAHRVMAVTIAIVIIVVLAVFGVYLYNRRYRSERYMSIQQSIEMSDQT